MRTLYAVSVNNEDYICEQYEFRSSWLMLIGVESQQEGLQDRIVFPIAMLTQKIYINKMEG